MAAINVGAGQSTTSVINVVQSQQIGAATAQANAAQAALVSAYASSDPNAIQIAEAANTVANQNLSNTIQSYSTTQGAIGDLSAQRASALSTAAALPPGPDQTAALTQAVTANNNLVAVTDAANNNGGTIPGASSSDLAITLNTSPTLGGSTDLVSGTPDPNTSLGSALSPTSDDNSLPVPPIPPSPSVPGSISATPGALQPTSMTNSTGTVPATAGSTSAQVSVSDQRIRLTPKNMSILGAGASSGNQFSSDLPASVTNILNSIQNPAMSSILSTGNSTSGSLLSPLVATQGLMFPYTPQIQYTGTANYGTQTPVHANQDYRYYTNTASTTVTIMGTFTAQTNDEATYMLASLHFLRTVTKMRFGASSSPGLPPPVLVLNGYGSGVFYNLPVIVTNFALELPNNVDYVKTTSAGITAWLPAHTTITVTCVVQNTPNKLRTFNWDAFASGALLAQGGWS